jgi:hypothetical protein
MGDSVKPDGVKAWIAEKYLHIVLCRGISLSNRPNIFSQSLKHDTLPLLMESSKVVIPVLARRSASARRRENGNPENSNYMKILDSCLRRNDKNLLLRFYTKPSLLMAVFKKNINSEIKLNPIYYIFFRTTLQDCFKQG